MEPRVLRYIWRHSRSGQLWMFLVIMASMPTYFLSLELPKRIVNSPIEGIGFERPGATAPFLNMELPFDQYFFGRDIVLFEGFELERVPFLLALSICFLLLVLANGLFKLYINTYKGRMGERLLRRLRYELFDRVLRYPKTRFRRSKPSEIASMIKDEVEPMGEFIGDAYTQPLFLGGQALVALLFIFLQNFWLGLATLVVILFQAWLIPILRRRLIVLQRQRQIEARKFAGRMGEIVEGISEAHVNDTTNYERAEVTSMLGRLFFIRFELYQRKFAVKFINNFLIQFLAFFFYAVGGYLAIRGTLDLGQLVGVIVAYKDLPAPVRGLIDHDQKRLQVEARYAQIVEQFDDEGLSNSNLLKMAEEPVPPIKDGYDISRLHVVDETGSILLEQATTHIAVNENVAVVGNFGDGATIFAEVLAGTIPPTSGKITLDGKPMEEQPEHFRGQRIGYVDGATFFPQGTIFDVLTYVLKNRPMGLMENEKASSFMKLERERAGNFEHGREAQWIDYERIGCKNRRDLEHRIAGIMRDIGMEGEIRGLGLRTVFDPEDFPDVASAIVDARHRFRERLEELGFTDFVEQFDNASYNNQATIAENLLFGTATSEEFEMENLPSNKLLRKVLKREGIENELFQLGKEIARTAVELFDGLEPEDPFFDELTFMEPDELPEYSSALQRMGNRSVEDVNERDRRLFMRLQLGYTESQFRLGLLTDKLKDKLLKARSRLRVNLEEREDTPIEFFEINGYNRAASLQDNVLLGRVSKSVAEGNERVSKAIQDLLDEMELTDEIFRIGLNFDIGSGGKRLSDSQRQKLHLARTLLKQPDVLIVNQGLNMLSAREQRAIMQNVLKRTDKDHSEIKCVIWVPMNAKFAELFDRVLVFKDGVLVSDGPRMDIIEKDETFQALVA